ncbi:MAG: hypothetical protein UR22_C0026G0009 [Parcubacteria group bacterium GW2011_GWC2_32_10]|nr:MAG: hypothetical protein UR22_C0026G0009 [Parcubacteria group bacterium GW2011_GWC2_32_10]
MEFATNVKNKCHDCNKEIVINGKNIENGFYLAYMHNEEKISVFKCNDCYAKSSSLTNFQKCEVYSRVVGYIRPVQQWNNGKKQEYNERQEYVMPSGESCGC